MRNERRRNEDARRIIAEQRHWGDVQLAEVDEDEEDKEAMQRGQNFSGSRKC